MVEDIEKIDSTFNKELFISKVNNIFISMLMAIVTLDIDNVYSSLSEEMRNKIMQRIETLKNNNEYQLYDELNVKDTRIVGTKITDDMFYIYVHLTSRYLDYKLDANRNYKSGNREFRITKDNSLVFRCIRNHKDLGSVSRCLFCGGNVDYNYTGLCPYCRKQFPKEDYDYVLIDWS